MAEQGWQLARFALACGLILMLACECAPPGASTSTPQPTATSTETVEGPLVDVPSPTATDSAGGGSAATTPQATPPPPTAVPQATETATPTPEAAAGGTEEPTPGPTSVSLCSDLELEIVFQQVQSLHVGETSIETTMEASGSVPLTVDVSASPPKVSGEGQLPITGGGHMGDCSLEFSGSIAYRLEGEILPGPDGHPELHLGGQREMQVVTSGSCGGGGGGAPFEEMAETVLPYEEGATDEWSWDVPEGGVHGSSKWVLHILCQR